MDVSMRFKLAEEVNRLILALEHLDPASNEYKITSEQICKLHKLIMDEGKQVLEETKLTNDENRRSLEFDAACCDENRKAEQYKKNHMVDCLRIGVEAAGIVMPLIFYAVWMRKGFEFEETGTITSSVFKNLIGRFRTTK